MGNRRSASVPHVDTQKLAEVASVNEPVAHTRTETSSTGRGRGMCETCQDLRWGATVSELPGKQEKAIRRTISREYGPMSIPLR
jgi:hypothetical protein